MNRQELIREFNSRAESYFKGLTFKPKTHEYFVGERKVPKSVSGIVKHFEEKTDFDAIAGHIARRDGVSKESILKAWKDKNTNACVGGTDTHDFAEHYKQDVSLKADTAKKKAVMHFWADLFEKNPGRYFIVGRELQMYHKLFFFSGTCDFILYDRLLNKFIIGDYKTNEDLFKNFREKTMLAPFENLLDCPYNFYQVQLNLYEILFKQLQYEVSEKWVVWLKGDWEEDDTKDSYKVYKPANFVPILEEWLHEQKLTGLLK